MHIKVFKKLPLIPLAELVAKGLTFVIVILLTRLLSVEAYGVFNYVVSFVLLISVFMDGGINNFVFNKSIKGELEEINDYFNGRMLLSVLTVAFFIIFAYFFQNPYFIPLSIYTVFVLLNSALAFFKMLARGTGDKRLDAQTILLDPFFRLAILALLYVLQLSFTLEKVLYLFVGVEVAVFGLVFWRSRKRFDLHLSGKDVWRKLLSVLRDSQLFLLYYFFFVGMQRLDVLFMQYTAGERAVALFSSAYNLYMVILLFFSSYLTSGLKAIVSHKTHLGSYAKQITFFYLLCTGAIFLLSDLIYDILYPPQYAGAEVYLLYLCVSLPFTIISYFAMYYFNYLEKTYLNVLLLSVIFGAKFLFLFFAGLKSVEAYVLWLIGFEVILGVVYLILLINERKRVIFENSSSQ